MPSPIRWRPRIRLRTLLFLLLVVSAGLAWVGGKLRAARDQQQAIRELQLLGAMCVYDYQMPAATARRSLKPITVPAYRHWSSVLLGDDLWANVNLVEFYPEEVDQDSKQRLLKMGLDRTTAWSRGLPRVRSREEQPKHESSGRQLFPPLVQQERIEEENGTSLRFCDEHMDLLTRLPHVRELNLSYTYITDDGLMHLPRLKHLEVLKLQGADIGDDGMRYVGKLTGLRELHLSYTHISDDGLVHLSRLRNLEKLFVNGTQIGDRGVESIATLGRMKVLFASETNISDEAVPALGSMQSLVQLNIYSTRIFDKGHASLREMLPNCAIQPKFW